MLVYLYTTLKKLVLREDPATSFNEVFFELPEDIGSQKVTDLSFDFGFAILDTSKHFSDSNYDETYFFPVANELTFNASRLSSDG